MRGPEGRASGRTADAATPIPTRGTPLPGRDDSTDARPRADAETPINVAVDRETAEAEGFWATPRGAELEAETQRAAESRRALVTQGATRPRTFGYTFYQGDVVFVYELNGTTNLVTDSATGERFRFEPKQAVEVAVAGDFDGWTPRQMQRAPRVSTMWATIIPRRAFPARTHQFKFVLDGRLWVEPPAYASNTAPAGVGASDAKNLVISLEHEE
jgi:hypothetical protein